MIDLYRKNTFSMRVSVANSQSLCKHPKGTCLAAVTPPESVIRIAQNMEHPMAFEHARSLKVARAHRSKTHHAAIGV
jgi:hypothetical protein